MSWDGVLSAMTATVTVAALALAGVALRAWALARTKRVLLLALGFSSLAAKGLFLSLVLFAAPSWSRSSALAASLAFDALALALFSGAVLRSSRSSASPSAGRRSATGSSSSVPADGSTTR